MKNLAEAAVRFRSPVPAVIAPGSAPCDNKVCETGDTVT